MKYESIYILPPDLTDAETNETLKKVETLVAKNGGEIIETDRWEKKRLAYPVKKHKYGYYVLLRLEAPATLVSLLEKHYRLTENIIKFLTIKVSEFKRESDFVVLPPGEEERSMNTYKKRVYNKNSAKDKEPQKNKPVEAKIGD